MHYILHKEATADQATARVGKIAVPMEAVPKRAVPIAEAEAEAVPMRSPITTSTTPTKL
jgi:hypothetical protein